MHLKKLELSGFKSFADKTKLDFEPGICAVIGPNGCGKSNTADAIRWCLGEQSARSMRSQQMMDVIFNGSQSRPTTGMAEVSLTFDNAQNLLPIDYSEVTVTRRLFRSGESEYFINKVQCRLKDIRDLFLDTGIGAEGYSIIEQGKVEFLLSAQPEERREMFEEAAGVSKYKVRREETLRKLEKVEVDMNRITDMLSLLKEQIAALDLAAKKARQYQKVKDELKRLEIASFVQHIQRGIQEIERISTTLDPKLREFETLNTTLDQTEASIAELRLTQTEKDEAYVAAQEEYSQIKSGITLADERIHQAAQRETELRERQDSLRCEIDDADAKLRLYRDERAGIESMSAQLKAQVESLEQDCRQKEEQLAAIRDRLGTNRGQENSIRSRMFSLAGEKTALRNEQNRVSSLLVHCQAQIVSLRKELERLQEQRRPVDEELAARKQELDTLGAHAADLAGQIQNISARISECENRLAQSRTTLSNVNDLLVSLDSKKQTLKEWEEKDPLRTTMRLLLAHALPGLRGPVSSLLSIEPGAESTVAHALGEKLDYMICDTAATAHAAIQFLEEQNLGRLSFIIQDQIPSAERPMPRDGSRPIIDALRFAQEHEAIIRFICGETHLSGSSVQRPAVIQGGGQALFDKPILIEDQMRTLEQNMETARLERTQATEQAQQYQAELESLLEERKTRELEQQRTGVQVELLEKQLSATGEKSQYLEKEIVLNTNDIQIREKEEFEFSEQLKNIEAAITRHEVDEQRLSGELAVGEADVLKLRDEENQLSPVLTEAKVALATHRNELASRQREDQKLEESITALKRQSETYTQELAAIETKLTELTELQSAETDRLKELHQQQSFKELAVQQTLAERQDILRLMEDKNTAVHTLRMQVESVSAETHQLQLEKRSFELQKQNMEQRLLEDYGQPYASLVQEYGALPVDEPEIARLKRRLESMGAVNLAAPEEYANLEERYTFLLTQQQDLAKAKDDLHHVITKINQTTRENFKKTFDLVRENFRTLYHQLFEGGEADLVLTDESNLLESGVDILAQPPGKKLQNITLLSGGEKALTAIALLFAFFMVRPSPVCLLDEVDAPLDDANIGRFINMIKEFSSRTQFLLITHNKRSMEIADVLYGVTMEELGVSKIISVKMNREDQLAVTA